MNIYDLKKASPDEVKDFIANYSTEASEQTYMKPLNEVELNIRRDEFAQGAMQKEDLMEELKEFKADHKLRLAQVQSKLSENLYAIKHRSIKVTGPAHKIPDYDNQMVHFIAPDGTVINSRPMLPEERQFTIQHQINKAV